MTNFSPCSGWGCSFGGSWGGWEQYSWVLCLQTRWGGPTGHLWDFQSWRFWCFLCAGYGRRVGSSMPAQKNCDKLHIPNDLQILRLNFRRDTSGASWSSAAAQICAIVAPGSKSSSVNGPSVEKAPCTNPRSDPTLLPKFLQNYAGKRVRQPRTPNTSAARKSLN